MSKRIGILAASDSFSEKQVSRMLPPEHAILATRPDPATRFTEYLIEGPMLPEAAVTEPPVLNVIFTMTLLDADGRVRVTGEWTRCDAHGQWFVGDWDSPDSYRAMMDTIAGAAPRSFA